jgi:thiamine monophosphate synthase
MAAHRIILPHGSRRLPGGSGELLPAMAIGGVRPVNQALIVAQGAAIIAKRLSIFLSPSTKR